MTKTKYYDLQMDDPQDDYDVEVVNANLKKIDEQMKTRENATDALQEPEFTVADKRENIASKEKMPKILGKIAKFFADLKAVAFTGNYNDLSDKPTSLPANGGNSDTVNSHTVESNVPKNAKFTDTTYSNFVKSGTGAKAGLVPAPSTTAGTTKYLREDGAWKTPPDTKTSVVNNNTTTEPGSALDARQANPNIEGTMAASIAQINSNLKIPVLTCDSNTTAVNVQDFVLSNLKSDQLSVMRVFNNAASEQVKNMGFEEYGNFFIIAMSRESYYVLIVVNHWDGKVWTITCSSYIWNWHFLGPN